MTCKNFRPATIEPNDHPPFEELAATLARHGAPAELIRRALAAADDERRHAALCSRRAEIDAGPETEPASAWFAEIGLADLPGLDTLRARFAAEARRLAA